MQMDADKKKLEEFRVQIDDLDRRILTLLNERSRIVQHIGRVKQKARLPIYEPRREDQVFENVTQNNCGPLTPEAVKRILQRLIDEMRRPLRAQLESGSERGASR